MPIKIAQKRAAQSLIANPYQTKGQNGLIFGRIFKRKREKEREKKESDIKKKEREKKRERKQPTAPKP